MEYDDVSIVADVSEELTDLIRKVQAVAEVNCLDLEYASSKLCRNVGSYVPINTASQPIERQYIDTRQSCQLHGHLSAVHKAKTAKY